MMDIGSYKDKIRHNITLLREARGISKAEMARLCGVSNPTVTNWENGRNSLDVEMLFKVAEILGTTVDALGGNLGEISIEEHDIIQQYRESSPEMQAAMRMMLYVQSLQKRRETNEST